METDNNTPNFSNKAGDGITLKRELNYALDIEMEKSPDEIDVKKVDAIVGLLNQLDNQETNDIKEISKEQFAKKYFIDRGIPYREIKVHKKWKQHIQLKMVAGFLFGIFLIGICNYVTVRATSKDIFTLVKEKAYILYFDVVGKSTMEKADESNGQTILESLEIEEQLADTWKEAQNMIQFKFKIPYFIPKGLEAKTIHVQVADEKNIGISRQYYNNYNNVRILIRSIDGNGKWISATDKMDKLVSQKEINGYSVSFYQTDDAVQAVYQDESFIYIIETNMGQKTLEKIVEEMR